MDDWYIITYILNIVLLADLQRANSMLPSSNVIDIDRLSDLRKGSAALQISIRRHIYSTMLPLAE